MQLSQMVINTHTLKNDSHFLLVDGKVSLKEDAENYPCDLHKKNKRWKSN